MFNRSLFLSIFIILSLTTKSAESLPEVKSPAKTMTVFYGNSFVERLQEDGTFEAYLQIAAAGQNLQFRSLAYAGDEVDFRVRPARFGNHLNYLVKQWPCSRVILFFGMNEAFGGKAGQSNFKKNLETYLAIIKDRHPNCELILVSPTAVQDLQIPGLPKAEQRNSDIADYTEIMRVAALNSNARFIDIFSTSKKLYEKSEQQLTTNGMHLNQAGVRSIAKILAMKLSSKDLVDKIDKSSLGFESLRRLVSRKAYETAMAYHPANGIHYYGLRGRSYEYNAEIPHHLQLANMLDKLIWQQASNLEKVLPMPELPFKAAEPPKQKPRKGLGEILSSEEDLKRFKTAEGYNVNLFATSEEYPELINPLQMRFDARGRLWVACFASYPVPVPGTLADDKVLIFEDTDGDGKADKRIVFADGLKLPDGFIFYKDGIVVSVSRKLLWLRDTNGDDKADKMVELLRGIDDTDTHHGGYLARTPNGRIIFNEALFHRAQFETPHGIVRTKNCATLYLNPVSGHLEIQRQTSHPNPWKISHGSWGEAFQMFGGGQIIDCDFYNVWTPVGIASPSSMGMPFRYDKGNSLEVVSSPHFPKSWQGGLLTAHLLGTNVISFTPLKLEQGVHVAADKPFDLLSSTNKSFRPTDLTFGLDGALYISDFYYPIIGHAQHSIRDMNRDYSNGRIWRVTRKDTPLAEIPKIHNAGVDQLLNFLKHPQITVRELARHQLELYQDAIVLAAVKAKISSLKNNDALKLELIWLLERLGDYSNTEFIKDLANSENIQAQRAAARLLQSWNQSLGLDAKTIARALINRNDERTKIILVGVISHLRQKDQSWNSLLDNLEVEKGTPLAKVVELAGLYKEPGLGPEFPLLRVDPVTKLTKWLKNKKGGSIYVKSNVVQDLILGHENNAFVNFDVNGLPVYRALGSQHSTNAQNTVTLHKGMNKIHYFLSSNKASKVVPHIYLASRVGKMATGLAFAKDETEHTAWAKEYEAKNATVSNNRITILAVPAKMAFNVTEFSVKAGKKYTFIFNNPDHMQHNLVITMPGKELSVGELADKMASQPDAIKKHYVPTTADIIFSTPLVPHNQKVEIAFKAPEKPGKYPYICTFPGHWRVMKGIMTVEK